MHETIPYDSVEVLGYRISARGERGDVEQAWRYVKGGNGIHTVLCLNPHSIVVARHDAAFREALKSSTLLIPDGTGVVMGSRILGHPVPERVAGFEFFISLTKLAVARGGLRYFFLGSTEEVLQGIRLRLEREFPSIRVSGTYSPPFRASFQPHETAEMIETINAATPDVLWVGMTAPKQEKWLHAAGPFLRVPLAAAVGAVFDFYAGTKSRSPAWSRRLGLEWLPRLLSEPRRLFQRNVVSTPVFLAMLLRETFKSPIAK